VAEYDVIVVGLGAMGSSAAYQLARRGQRVLGLDAFEQGHTLGSSHGETRIIRMAYFEHPDYVPLLRRAYELWAQTQAEAQVELLRLTGGLYVGLPDSELVAGSLLSARTYGLAHELLSGDDIRRRFPALQPSENEVGLFEDQAGILFPERCIDAHLTLARAAGAELHHAEPVTEWWSDVGGVSMQTPGGKYSAARLVVTAGARIGKLLPWLNGVVVAERIPLFWFEPRSDLGQLPVLIWHDAQLGDFYTVPHVDWPGVKLGKHHSADTCDPETVNRDITAADEQPLRAFLEAHIPALNGPVADARVCLYENSPDEHFIIDVNADGIVYAGGFSGHGFKFASVVGEILADLATTGRTTPAADFLRLRLDRLAQPSQRLG
jgi:sarcosine oxidase